MREALEHAHRGFGQSTITKLSRSDQVIQTKPFQLVTGRVWKGATFGGWKPRSDIPKLVNKVLLGELKINQFKTSKLDSLDKLDGQVQTDQNDGYAQRVIAINI